MAPNQHYLVLGATGASGLTFTRMALQRTPTPRLTLLARTPSKIPSELSSNPNVRVVEGGLQDKSALNTALSGGITTVLSFLGAPISLSAFLWRTKTTPIADALPTVFEAMRRHGVNRILALSTASHALSGEVLPWKLSAFMMMPPLIVPQGNAEMIKIAESVVKQDDFDWTVFRVPHLSEGGEGGVVECVERLTGEFRGSTDLSRESMCEWLVREVEERRWVGKAPFISNP